MPRRSKPVEAPAPQTPESKDFGEMIDEGKKQILAAIPSMSEEQFVCSIKFFSDNYRAVIEDSARNVFASLSNELTPGQPYTVAIMLKSLLTIASSERMVSQFQWYLDEVKKLRTDLATAANDTIPKIDAKALLLQSPAKKDEPEVI